MNAETIKINLLNWRKIVKNYQKPNPRKAIVQLLNSFLPFLGLYVLMYFSLSWSIGLTLGLSVIAAFFLVRIFIIQHDCGHHSFLKSRKWNNLIGFVSSFISTIPFKYWSRTHSEHHAHNGQLEFRGVGDIYFMTREEYQQHSRFRKLMYRIYRHPFMQFIIVPVVYLSTVLRYPYTQLKGWKKVRSSFFLNNLMILAFHSLLILLLGWQTLLLVTLPILGLFGVIAFWFFYIQHQHGENYKEKKENWNHLLASMRGSTYYKLPRLFQWLSGNIGFHHIHHLNSRIPNYNLQACATENPQLNEAAQVLTFRQSLECIHHKLWDEQVNRMISFREYARTKVGRGKKQ